MLFVFDHSRLSLTIQSQKDLSLKLQPHLKEDMLSTALDFLKSKRVTDHYSILLPQGIGFPQELLPP